MTIRLNWDRIKQLDADLKSDGWKEDDKLLFIMIEKTGKAKKSIVSFQDLNRFCWNMVDDEALNVLTFVIQDLEGKVLYRHRQVVFNEEIPIGGSGDIITQWAMLTDEEKETFIDILVSQINAYEDNPLNSMPQGEWDAFISSILKPFLIYAKNDPLICYDDLQQEAWVALLNAAGNYDPTKAKFSTYAYYYIRGRMLRYVLEKSRLASSRIDADPLDIEKGYTDNSNDEQEQMRTMLGVVADEPYSNFLVEYYIKGKSFRNIAKENNLSHQGVASHIKKLLSLLEKRLNCENA